MDLHFKKLWKQNNNYMFPVFIIFLFLRTFKLGEMDEKITNILDRATQMFMKYGIRNISMDDICRDLGISKKTLYQFVENKADLLEKIFFYSNELQRKQFEERMKPEMNAIDQLFEASKIISDSFKKFNPSITFELSKFFPALFEEMKKNKHSEIYSHILVNLDKGIQEGLYRDDMNSELTAHLYMQKLESCQNPEFFGKLDLSFENIFEVMFENHIRGIANTKGIEYFEEQKKTMNYNIK